MEKRKITANWKILSIAILTVSILMLATVSYAYFTANVEGNDKAKVTTVTAGEMKLEYKGDANVNLANILPGETRTITFTVTNIGTVTAQYNVDLIDVTNTFEHQEELQFSLKRDSKEVKGESQLPNNDITLQEGISIGVEETHNYTLTIHYIETNSEQNYNQNKNFNCSIQINGFSPYKTILGKSYPIISEDPDFSVGCPLSSSDNCSGLYIMEDDEGTSYYFRGEVDNYVKFGQGTTYDDQSKHELTWRIVRVNGDGTIRLVLDSDIGTSMFNSTYNAKKYVGYTYDNKTPCTNASSCKYEYNNGTFSSNNTGTSSTIKGFLEEWYSKNLSSYDSKIEYGTYCNDTSYGSGDETWTLHYGAYERRQNASPQLTCPNPTVNGNVSSDVAEVNGTKYRTYGGVYKLKIGLLSGDEIVLAGFKPITSSGVTDTNYLYYTGYSNSCFWSSSPYYSNSSDARDFGGRLGNRYLYYGYVNDAYGVRPVINISTDGLTATGKGTKEDPFVIP